MTLRDPRGPRTLHDHIQRPRCIKFSNFFWRCLWFSLITRPKLTLIGRILTPYLPPALDVVLRTNELLLEVLGALKLFFSTSGNVDTVLNGDGFSSHYVSSLWMFDLFFGHFSVKMFCNPRPVSWRLCQLQRRCPPIPPNLLIVWWLLVIHFSHCWLESRQFFDLEKSTIWQQWRYLSLSGMW